MAKHLGCEPNGALYAKVRDWRRRRQEELGLAAIDVPPGAESGFRAILDQLTADATDHFVRTIRLVGSDIDRSAALRVTDAERRRNEAQAETAEVLELCQRAEAALAAAMARIGALEQTLAEAQRREDVLRGRLEQREADAARPDVSTQAGEPAIADRTAAPPSADARDDDAPVQQVVRFDDSDGGSA